MSGSHRGMSRRAAGAWTLLFRPGNEGSECAARALCNTHWHTHTHRHVQSCPLPVACGIQRVLEMLYIYTDFPLLSQPRLARCPGFFFVFSHTPRKQPDQVKCKLKMNEWMPALSSFIRNMCTPAHSCNYPLSLSYGSSAMLFFNLFIQIQVYIKHQNGIWVTLEMWMVRRMARPCSFKYNVITLHFPS